MCVCMLITIIILYYKITNIQTMYILKCIKLHKEVIMKISNMFVGILGYIKLMKYLKETLF